jgi:biopolymer transport protein ExbB
MLHAWLERKVEAHSHRMDDAVTRVFTRDLSLPPPILAKESEPAPTAGTERLDDAA